MSDLLHGLKAHPFLARLRDDHLLSLAELTQARAFPSGAWLCRTVDDAATFFLIRSGRVAIEIVTPRRGTVRIQTLDAGDIVGWSWAMPPHRWQFDARAVDAVETWGLDGAALRALCARDSELGRELYQRLLAIVSGRLTATRLLLLDVYR